MKILKSDFCGLKEFLIQDLGLDTRSIYPSNDYFYFRPHDLLKKDHYNWAKLDSDVKDSLVNMGMIFSPKGFPVGETADSRNEAKNVKAIALRKYAKERSADWKAKSEAKAESQAKAEIKAHSILLEKIEAQIELAKQEIKAKSKSKCPIHISFNLYKSQGNSQIYKEQQIESLSTTSSTPRSSTQNTSLDSSSEITKPYHFRIFLHTAASSKKTDPCTSSQTFTHLTPPSTPKHTSSIALDMAG